jgi:hypothetical protein
LNGFLIFQLKKWRIFLQLCFNCKNIVERLLHNLPRRRPDQQHVILNNLMAIAKRHEPSRKLIAASTEDIQDLASAARSELSQFAKGVLAIVKQESATDSRPKTNRPSGLVEVAKDLMGKLRQKPRTEPAKRVAAEEHEDSEGAQRTEAGGTREIVIFYSWQSDLPNNTNRGFIGDALGKAVKDIKKDRTLAVDPVIDRDTLGRSGSPDIRTVILEKIDACDAFVCDVSIVARYSDGKKAVPNPNVLLELGYALKRLGWSRIVLVMNTDFGGPEELPFDLRSQRVMTYEVGEDKAEARKELVGKLRGALEAIVSK